MLQTVRENTRIKKDSLEVNSEKNKYMITSRQQNVVQNQNIIIGTLSTENLEKFIYLGVTITNKNGILRKLNAE